MEIYFRRFFLAMQNVAKRGTVGILCMVVVGLTAMSCEKDSKGHTITRYKTVGEGYIWDATNNRPLKDATITVSSCFSHGGWFAETPSKETFTTDANGYYQIRFIKKVKNEKVFQFLFEVGSGPMLPPPPPYWVRCNPGGTFPDAAIYPKDIEGKKTITLDTIKYYLSNF